MLSYSHEREKITWGRRALLGKEILVTNCFVEIETYAIHKVEIY